MQTYECYFENGRFVPAFDVSIPEGSRAIVTIPERPRMDVDLRLKAFLARIGKAIFHSEEELPREFDSVKSWQETTPRELEPLSAAQIFILFR